MFKTYKQLRKLNNSKLSEDEWYGKDSSGKGIIDVGAENYDDIFSYYDLEGENTLDWEFIDFLEKKADAIPLKEELALHFHVKNSNEDKRTEIDNAIKNHYKREIKAKRRELKRNSITCLYLLIMGLFALGAYVALTIFEVYFVVPYIFDLVAWVFLWETVDNFFIKRKVIKHEMLSQFRFVRSEVRVFEYKNKNRGHYKFNNAKFLNNILNQSTNITTKKKNKDKN